MDIVKNWAEKVASTGPSIYSLEVVEAAAYILEKKKEEESSIDPASCGHLRWYWVKHGGKNLRGMRLDPDSHRPWRLVRRSGGWISGGEWVEDSEVTVIRQLTEEEIGQ